MSRTDKLFVWLIGILLLCMILGAVGAGWPAAPQEGPATACDNNRSGKSKAVDHTCECPRSMKDCDPDDPEMKQPGAKCKTYCKPDHCDCQNACTS